MSERIIVVLGDPFRNDSPRTRRLQAERLVDSLGLKKPSLFRRVLAWFGLSKKGNV